MTRLFEAAEQRGAVDAQRDRGRIGGRTNRGREHPLPRLMRAAITEARRREDFAGVSLADVLTVLNDSVWVERATLDLDLDFTQVTLAGPTLRFLRNGQIVTTRAAKRLRNLMLETPSKASW